MLAPHPASIACQSNIQKQLTFSLLTQTKLFLTAKILKYSSTFFSEVDKCFGLKLPIVHGKYLQDACSIWILQLPLEGAMLKRC
jgi:hypothetical protein